MGALLALMLEPGSPSLQGLSMQAAHVLLSKDLLPLLAKPTDPEQVSFAMLLHPYCITTATCRPASLSGAGWDLA